MPILLRKGGRHDAEAAQAVENMIQQGYMPEYNQSRTAYRWRNAKTGDVYMGSDLGGLGVSEGVFTKKRGLKRAVGRMVGDYYSAGLFPEAEYLSTAEVEGETGAEEEEGAEEEGADGETGSEGNETTTVDNTRTTHNYPRFGGSQPWLGYGQQNFPFTPNPKLTTKEEEPEVEEQEEPEVEEETGKDIGATEEHRGSWRPEQYEEKILLLEEYLANNPDLGDNATKGIQDQIDELQSELNWGFPVWSFSNWISGGGMMPSNEE